MGIEENINQLFEEAQKEEDRKEQHRPKDEPMRDLSFSKPDADEGGLERREFSRIDLESKSIAVAFNSELQFAKHYVQNISLGGMFVKTTDKYKFGQIIPIQFRVKNENEGTEELFSLRARVCRIIDSGVGLEFTNLDAATRARLEAYVRSVLPNGMQIRTQAKQSTIDRLKQIREEKYAASQFRKKTFFQVAAIASLLLCNAFLVSETIKEVELSNQERIPTFKVGEQEIQVQELRAIQRDPDGQFIFELNNGRQIYASSEDLNEKLPRSIKNQIQILKTQRERQEIRKSLNSGNVQLR